MSNSHDVLLDNRAFIQIGSHVVRCCADQLYAAFVRLFIRVCPLEGRQERVVDVDNPARHFLTQLVRQDLHVTGQHHQFGAALFDDRHLGGLGLGFVLFRDLDVVEGNVVVHDDFLIVEMVRDHAHDLDRQGANPGAVKQVVQAVPKARHHDDNLHLLAI